MKDANQIGLEILEKLKIATFAKDDEALIIHKEIDELIKLIPDDIINQSPKGIFHLDEL